MAHSAWKGTVDVSFEGAELQQHPKPGSTFTVGATNSSRPTRGRVLARSLEKRFGPNGEVLAVHGFDLDVVGGEFVSLLGPSGSGKTTTLLMVAGFEKPTAGKIVIDGSDLTNIPPHRRNIGMVFQNYALFPHMSVFDNIAFPLKMRRIKRKEIERKVQRSLELVHLSGYERRFPRELSGGQQQRVALARATVYGPPLLLMDEPLSALDRGLRDEMQLEIKRIHRDLDTSILYVTHDQEEALSLSDRVVVMRDGAIEQVGTARDVYEHPQTHFVARFLGESNFLAGRALTGSQQGGEVFVEIDSGQRLTGGASVSIKPNERVLLSIRPEKLTLAVEANVDDKEHTLDVRVEDWRYFGSQIRMVGAFSSGERCTVHVSPGMADGLSNRPVISVKFRGSDAVVIREAD